MHNDAWRTPPPLRPFFGKTILLIGDSNERALVDALCDHTGNFSRVVKSNDPFTLSEAWHADAHVCYIRAAQLEIISFMSFGVLVDDDLFWQNKSSVEPPMPFNLRADLAQKFMRKLGRKPDLIVASASGLHSLFTFL